MQNNGTNNKRQSIANFAAIKTAIANNEEKLLKELLADQMMQALEKSYLIELAQLNNNSAILETLKAIPLDK
tara:strand:- start:14502 stop:14717 length:216 start_codon:yes stop_codon:yes gene_type:complete